MSDTTPGSFEEWDSTPEAELAAVRKANEHLTSLLSKEGAACWSILNQSGRELGEVREANVGVRDALAKMQAFVRQIFGPKYDKELAALALAVAPPIDQDSLSTEVLTSIPVRGTSSITRDLWWCGKCRRGVGADTSPNLNFQAGSWSFCPKCGVKLNWEGTQA